MAILDCLLTFEAPVVTQKPNNVVLGALMHRFPTDKSIRAYCNEHGLHDPLIGDDGSVWAYGTYESVRTERQIGWIS